MFYSLSLWSPHKDSYFMIKSPKLSIPVPLFIVKKLTATQNKNMSIQERIIFIVKEHIFKPFQRKHQNKIS